MKQVQQSWRSMFWNITLSILLTLMFVLVFFATGLKYFFRPGGLPAGIGFTALAVVLLIGAVRALFIGVSATSRGIVVRGLTGTEKIPWDEISQIALGGVTSGASGAAGAQAPVIVRQRPGAADKVIELKELGSYGIGGGRSVAERSVEDLQKYLAAWREQNRDS